MSATTTDPPVSQPSPNRVFTVVSGTTLLVVAAQFALAGFATFQRQRHDAGDGWFEPHQALGYVIAVVSIVLLVVAIVAHRARPVVVRCAVLVVFTAVLQPALAGLGADVGALWGGLHALSGFAIAGIAGTTFGDAIRSGER